MTNEEIVLFGQPIDFVVPEKPKNKVYDCLTNNMYYMNRSDIPKLIAGQKYKGYLLGEDIYSLDFSWYNIYIEIDNQIYKFNMSPFSYEDKIKTIKPAQEEINFKLMRKMFLTLYNKINEIEDQLSNKVDRD